MPRKKRKSISHLVDDYLLSSRIHDYYLLPLESRDKIMDVEGDYFAVRLQAAIALSKDGKIVKGIQNRLVNAIRNSFTAHCFAGYDMKDTIVSVNQNSEGYSSNIFNLHSLEPLLDSTSCSAVRIFSGRMDNGCYKLAARLEEKGAALYVHKGALYLAAFEMLGAFIKSESDREWLVDEMQRIAEYKAGIHF